MARKPPDDGLTAQQRYRQSDKYKATRKLRQASDENKAYQRQATKKSREKHSEKISLVKASKEFKEKRSIYFQSLSVERRAELNKKAKIFYQENKEKILLKQRESYLHPEVKKRTLEKSKKRRSQLSFATPSWANKDAMNEIYTRRGNYDVDHVIPLRGKNVSGLHCAANLQYLTSEQNKSKYNHFDESKLPSLCENMAFDSNLHEAAIQAVMRRIL